MSSLSSHSLDGADGTNRAAMAAEGRRCVCSLLSPEQCRPVLVQSLDVVTSNVIHFDSSFNELVGVCSATCFSSVPRLSSRRVFFRELRDRGETLGAVAERRALLLLAVVLLDGPEFLPVTAEESPRNNIPGLCEVLLSLGMVT